MTRAILIPVEGPVSLLDFNSGDPHQWADLLGAQACDIVTWRERGLQAIIDDRAILDGRAVNLRATWMQWGSGRWAAHPLHGPVLLVGVDDNTGESVDLHPTLAASLMAVVA